MAELKMRRTLHRGSFLVLEGKDDIRFWTSRCHGSCRLVDGNGKNNVVRSLQRLDEIGFAGVSGLIDRDHDHLAGRPVPSPNIVATDAHDLECLLCRSSALGSVLAEFGEREKIEQFEQETGEDVRTKLLRRGLVFGRLMWVARQIDPGVASLAVWRCVDEASWEVDEEGLFVEAAERLGIDESILRSRVAQLPQADPWHVVRGHELIELLRIGLRKRLGDLPTSTGVQAIGRVLRTAMPEEDLQATTMWRDMTWWEALNTPCQVLPRLVPAEPSVRERSQGPGGGPKPQ